MSDEERGASARREEWRMSCEERVILSTPYSPLSTHVPRDEERTIGEAF
jgi:hypothetical protein